MRPCTETGHSLFFLNLVFASGLHVLGMGARGCSCPAVWMPSGRRLEIPDSRTHAPQCCGHSQIWRSCTGALGGDVLRTLSEHLDARHAASSSSSSSSGCAPLSKRCSSCGLALQRLKSRIEGRYLLGWTCCFLAHAVAVDKAALIRSSVGWSIGGVAS